MADDKRIARLDALIEVRADGDPEAEDGVIRGAVASDETLDSHGTIIKAGGWDLQRYSKNPVLIWSHKASGFLTEPEPEDVLGTAKASVSGDSLVADLNFDMESPKAAEVYRKMKNKVIRALSVGFRPREWHYEDRGDREIMVITKAELAEISVVPIPSNPNTLARSLADMCPKPPPESPAGGEGETEMPDTKKTEAVFPASIASLLGVDTEDAAVREISKVKLELDKATKENGELRARAEKAEKDLNDRIDADTTRDVEARIASGVISEDRRDAALALARADRDSFLKMYPNADAPKAADLTRKLVEADKPEPTTAKALDMATFADLVPKRAKHYEDKGMDKMEATSRALNDVLTGAFKGE